MSLRGIFLVDDKPIAHLDIMGVGVFPAFSGNKMYRNRAGCTAILNNGPLPDGQYWIVDRPTGGIRSWAWAADIWNTALGSPTDRKEWFALYRDDGMIDDYTWVGEVQRGNFRLHPVGGEGVSYGCITLTNHADFQAIRLALLNTKTIPAGNSGLLAYGTIEVIARGKTCP